MDNQVLDASVATRPQKPRDTTARPGGRSASEVGRARCANCGAVFVIGVGGRIINRHYCDICRAVPPLRALAHENKEFCRHCRATYWGRGLCGYCEAVILGPPALGPRG